MNSMNMDAQKKKCAESCACVESICGTICQNISKDIVLV